jgi:hypothetical protein
MGSLGQEVRFRSVSPLNVHVSGLCFCNILLAFVFSCVGCLFQGYVIHEFELSSSNDLRVVDYAKIVKLKPRELYYFFYAAYEAMIEL